jgi:hypothetical protein
VTGPEFIIVAVIALPVWIGGLVFWWSTMRSRRSTPISTSSAPAGWHSDPTGRYELRYRDGQRWTEHVSRDGVAAVDPLG